MAATTQALAGQVGVQWALRDVRSDGEDVVQDILECTEQNRTLTPDYPILTCRVRHAECLHNRCRVGQNGRAPWERVVGNRRGPTDAEFGERVMFLTKGPHKGRQWSSGVWLGLVTCTHNTDVGTPEGVARAWTIKRIRAQDRWKTYELLAARSTTQPYPQCEGGGGRVIFATRNFSNSLGRELGRPSWRMHGQALLRPKEPRVFEGHRNTSMNKCQTCRASQKKPTTDQQRKFHLIKQKQYPTQIRRRRTWPPIHHTYMAKFPPATHRRCFCKHRHVSVSERCLPFPDVCFPICSRVLWVGPKATWLLRREMEMAPRKVHTRFEHMASGSRRAARRGGSGG